LAVSLMSLGQKVKLHFRARGVPDGLRLAPLRLARKVAGSAYRRSVHPLLNDLYAMSPHVFQTPEEILMRFTDATESALVGLRAEWGVLRTTLDQRSGVRQLKYPTFYAVTSDSSFLLYALVRLRRPASILETGVANGHSTYFLLHALRANGTGRLYSVDISSDVGVLLDPAEREGWTFLQLEDGQERKQFRAFVERAGSLDLFLHDSDHSYWWQMFEYRCAWAMLSPGGLFLSDDIDHSFAFMDFCAEHKLEPSLLVNFAKIFGILETAK
jgi:hypothetical protein